jgi:hypothetical protein
MAEGRGRKSSDQAYYNTGSCVHPRCITGIEITPGKDGKPAFTLIKWGYTAQGAGRSLSIQREELENNRDRNLNSGKSPYVRPGKVA